MMMLRRQFVLKAEDSYIFFAVIRQCLKKHMRLLHSKLTSKTQLQTTLIKKCPVLLEVHFTVGFFEKKWIMKQKIVW